MKYVVYTSIRSSLGVELHRAVAEFNTHREAEDYVFIEKQTHQKQKYFKDIYIVEEKEVVNQAPASVDVKKKKVRKNPNVGP